MIYKITIGDNDYNFIMQQAIKYVIECRKYDEYKNTPIKDIFEEYLTCMQVNSGIVVYILDRLEVTEVKDIPKENMDSEVYYLHNNSYVLR